TTPGQIHPGLSYQHRYHAESQHCVDDVGKVFEFRYGVFLDEFHTDVVVEDVDVLNDMLAAARQLVYPDVQLQPFRKLRRFKGYLPKRKKENGCKTTASQYHEEYGLAVSHSISVYEMAILLA